MTVLAGFEPTTQVAVGLVTVAALTVIVAGGITATRRHNGRHDRALVDDLPGLVPVGPWDHPYRVGNTLHAYRDCRDMRATATPWHAVDPDRPAHGRQPRCCRYCKERTP